MPRQRSGCMILEHHQPSARQLRATFSSQSYHLHGCRVISHELPSYKIKDLSNLLASNSAGSKQVSQQPFPLLPYTRHRSRPDLTRFRSSFKSGCRGLHFNPTAPCTIMAASHPGNYIAESPTALRLKASGSSTSGASSKPLS